MPGILLPLNWHPLPLPAWHFPAFSCLASSLYLASALLPIWHPPSSLLSSSLFPGVAHHPDSLHSPSLARSLTENLFLLPLLANSHPAPSLTPHPYLVPSLPTPTWYLPTLLPPASPPPALVWHPAAWHLPFPVWHHPPPHCLALPSCLPLSPPAPPGSLLPLALSGILSLPPYLAPSFLPTAWHLPRLHLLLSWLDSPLPFKLFLCPHLPVASRPPSFRLWPFFSSHMPTSDPLGPPTTCPTSHPSILSWVPLHLPPWPTYLLPYALRVPGSLSKLPSPPPPPTPALALYSLAPHLRPFCSSQEGKATGPG